MSDMIPGSGMRLICGVSSGNRKRKIRHGRENRIGIILSKGIINTGLRQVSRNPVSLANYYLTQLLQGSVFPLLFASDREPLKTVLERDRERQFGVVWYDLPLGVQ